MDQSLLVPIFGVIAGLFGWIFSLVLKQLAEIRTMQTEIAVLSTEVERLTDEMGTHESGLRGSVHTIRNGLLRLEGKVMYFEEQRIKRANGGGKE